MHTMRMQIQQRLLYRDHKICKISLLLFCLAGMIGIALRADWQSSSVQVQETTLVIDGLKRPYEIFVLADKHISLCDSTDATFLEKANARRQAFWQESGKNAAKTFSNLVTYANESESDLTVLAGDIIDSAMSASIDFTQKQLKRLDMPYLYILGNHDFEYGKEYFTKTAYREYFPRLTPLTGTNQQYVVKEYDDLVVIGINDQNNQIPKSAAKAVLPFLKGKKPVVFVLHVPLKPQFDNSQLERTSIDIWGASAKGKCRVLMGKGACEPNKTTRRFLKAVFAPDSPVAAVIAGHIHFYNQSQLDGKKQQVVCAAGYYGSAVKINMQPGQ